MKKKPGKSIKPSMTNEDLAVFFSHFHMLLSTGVPIMETFKTLAIESTHPILKETLIKIHDEFKGGKGLSAPMRETPEIFTPTMVSMIAVGEANGTVDVVLQRLAEHYKYIVSLERNRP